MKLGFAYFFTGKWHWIASEWDLRHGGHAILLVEMEVGNSVRRLDDWDVDLAGKLGLHLALALLDHLNTELSFIPVVLSHIQRMNL